MVNTLDTLPAVSLCRVLLLVFVGVVPWCYSVRTFYLYVCRGLCLSDGEPVSLSDVLPVAVVVSDGEPVSL